MNTKESITALLEHDDKVKVAGIDIDGVLRGKIMSKTKFLSSIPDGFGTLEFPLTTCRIL
jgi:glutamine synthetase